MATVNPWLKFKRLLPEPARLYGVVTKSHNDGTVTVTLRQGGKMRVAGAENLDVAVWIKDGAIIGSAPTLSVQQISI